MDQRHTRVPGVIRHYERPGRREARYRRERNGARVQVKALEQRVENLVAREVARIAPTPWRDGFDLIVFMPGDYSDMVDKHGAGPSASLSTIGLGADTLPSPGQRDDLHGRTRWQHMPFPTRQLVEVSS